MTRISSYSRDRVDDAGSTRDLNLLEELAQLTDTPGDRSTASHWWDPITHTRRQYVLHGVSEQIPFRTVANAIDTWLTVKHGMRRKRRDIQHGYGSLIYEGTAPDEVVLVHMHTRPVRYDTHAYDAHFSLQKRTTRTTRDRAVSVPHR